MSKLSPLILLLPTLAWAYPASGLSQTFQLQYSIAIFFIVVWALLLIFVIRGLVLYRQNLMAELMAMRRSLKKIFFLRPSAERHSPPSSSAIKPKENGFSLAEVMVTAGLLAGLSLVVMQITKNQQQTINYAESKSEELELYNRIRVALLQKDVCEATFAGSSLSSSLSRIRQASGTDLYVVGNEYGNRALRLTGLRLNNQSVPSGGGTGTVNLRVTTERLKQGMRPPAPRDIALTVTTDSSGQIIECFADTEGTILTSKEEMCQALGGVFDEAQNQCALLVYPDPSPVDHHGASTKYVEDALAAFETEVIDDYLPLTGGTLTGALIVQDNVQAENITSDDRVNATRFCIGGNCRTTFANQQCAAGSVVTRINPNGTIVCQSLTCPTNQFFAGLNASGNPVCRPFPTNTCPTNEYVAEVRPNGTVVCKPVPYHWAVGCSPGMVLQSVSADGTPTCVNPGNRSMQCNWDEAVRGFDPMGNLICVPRGFWSKATSTNNKTRYLDGNVGVGVANPNVKLDVEGEIKVGNTAAPCNLSREGAIRYKPVSKKLEYCDGSSWLEVNPDEGSELDLVNGFHSSAQCTAIGGTVVTSGGAKFCRFNSSTCPSGWLQYENWRAYGATKHCYDPPGCLPAQGCTTTTSAWSNSSSAPTCEYPLTYMYSGSDGPSPRCGSMFGASCSGGAFSNCNVCVPDKTRIGCF